MDLARSRDTRIQNVAHDLRQPLHALRLSIMNLQSAQHSEPGAAQKIEASFDYLETLIARQLEANDDIAPPGGGDDAPIAELGLQEILSAVEEMFRSDAHEKGLSLRLRPSDLDAQGDALVLTRILSNLVSNAIKYTDSGGILIGTRKKKGTIRVEIHDTGSGMSEAEFAEASKRNVRLQSGLSRAEGSGLGLAIAIDLAQRNGMRIERSNLRETGLGLVLVIPQSARG
jgi:signal transduction histidine kinase